MHQVVFQSPFGEWRVASTPPPLDLAPYVHELWETQGAVGYGYEKLIPSGCAEFMINLGPPHKVLRCPSDAAPAVYRDGWLSGIHDGPLFTAPAHGNCEFHTHFVGARLKPVGVFALFGVEAIETANRVIEAEDLPGRELRSHRDRMGEAESTVLRFGLLCELLRLQLSEQKIPVHSAAVWAMERTLEARGNVSIENLCKALGISRKHLNALYKRGVGLSPKGYARLARFRAVMARLENPAEDWAGIAAAAGYFDQPHLVRDFKQFAGESPDAFIRSRGPDGESVSYDDVPDRS